MTEGRRSVGVADRTLPHDLEAEKSVLGAILLHNDAYETVAGILMRADFYRDAHQRIFASFDRLLELKGGKADYITLRDDLIRRGELDEVGGPAYITGLTDGVGRSANVAHYARIVKEKAQLRGAIRAMNGVISKAYEAEESAAEILAAADKALVELQSNGGAGRMLSLESTNRALMESLEWRHAHKGELTGVETGFESINEITLGWQSGDLIVLGARPSIGKTAFTMNSATAGARAGRKVAMFSLEMRRQQLEFRMLADLSGIPLSRCLSGQYMAADWEPLSQAVSQIRDLPIHINDATGMSVWDIRSDCRRLKAEEGLDLVIIDYVQLVAGSLDRRGASRNEEITDISRRLKTLADELAVPIILLSQLSRAGDKRNDPKPKLSDLRESGALEQDADIVAFLHRRNHREGGLTYFLLEKQRNGPTGTLKLTMDRDVVRFTDGYVGPEPEPDQPKRKKGAKAQPPVETDRFHVNT